MFKFINLACLGIILLGSVRVRCQEVTLDRDKVSLESLFLEIHSQTGYFFYYSVQDLADAKPVTIHVQKAPLEEVLSRCFAGQSLIYQLDNKTIVVHKKTVRNDTLYEARGKVLNEDGDPVEDVIVEEQETRRTAVTNSEGVFSLDQIPQGSILLISHVGYQTTSVTRKNSLPTIILKRSISKLDEVQVIAYGTTTKRLNTGNVATVKSEDIQKQPITDPLSALEGRVSGLTVIQKTGVAGSGFQVLVRGQNSLASGNDPLYIVDGVPFPSSPMGSAFSGIIQNGDPLGSIDPASINSIEVLKDADATAIYGSRGANGVILITTKKGMPGKTQFDFSAYTGILKNTRRMKLLSNSEYLQMRREAFKNDGTTPDASSAPDLFLWDTTRSTDWQKVLTGRTGMIHDVHAALNGGDSLTNFRVGGGYHEETSVFPGDFADRKGAAQASLQHRSTSGKFYLQLSGNYLAEKNHLPGSDLTYQALTLPPDAPKLYDAQSNLNWEQSSWNNPLSITKTFFEAYTENAMANIILNYHLLSDLELRLTGGITRMDFREISTFPTSSDDPALGITNGSAEFAQNKTSTWIMEPQIRWQHTLGPGKMQILLGSTFQRSTQNSQTLNASGYTNDALLENISGAATISLYSAQELQYKYQALFARILYNIRNQWIIDLTGRRDGSSRFGPGKQFALFGAGGISWIFSNQSFFRQHLPVLSFGKIRASWGVTGNDQIGDYQYLSTYSPTSYPYQGSGGLFPNNLANPDYSWEKNTKWEIGLETGWIKDCILINASYYTNRSSNQLVGFPLPTITGFASIVANLPAVLQNTGWEFDVISRIFQFGAFTWVSTLNLSIPKNKLIAFPGLAGSSYVHRYVIGKPIGVVQAFHQTGVDTQTGIYSFEDFRGNPTANPSYPADLQPLKTIAQQYFGGLENTFRYKRWRLDIFFQYVKQTGRNYLYEGFTAPGTLGNQPEIVARRWQKPGDQTSIQQYTQDQGSAAYNAFNTIYNYGDNTIGDASFVSLKNLLFSYSWPARQLKKSSFSLFRLYVQGQNLLTISHYNGPSPQTQSFSNIPLLTTLTGGFQITF